MSQEYYSLEKKSNIGNLSIGLHVFESIASGIIENIDGVKLNNAGGISISGSKNCVEGMVNKNNQVTINIEILIDYGVNVSEIITLIQTNISTALFEMIGIKGVMINVDVKGISF